MPKRWSTLICSLTMLIAGCMLFYPTLAQAAPSHNRLYVITLAGSTDAMILESDGHFALIDAGEDKSYPNGTDPRYPLREGITTDPERAVDDRLFTVIKILGIQKFDFAIGTHTHSDHIGNLPEVLNRYPVDKVFLKRYTDERILDNSSLWDNLYGYDRVIEAARKNKVKLIQDITPQDAHMVMGNMTIDLYNYENEWADANRTVLKPVNDDNVNSILTVISVAGKRIYLGGDLQNYHGHEDKYGPIIGKVDFMKANHHGDCGPYTNTPNFIDHLRPSIVLKNATYLFPESFQQKLNDMHVKVYSAGRSDVPAIAFDFSTAGGIQEVTHNIFTARGFSEQNGRITYTKWDGAHLSPGLTYLDNELYLLNADGTVATGWQKVNDHTYYFDPKNHGAALQGSHTIDGETYFFNYYRQLHTGWIQKSGKWYYILSNGSILTSTTTPDGWVVDKQGCCIGKWMRNDTGWWWQYPDYSYPSNQWVDVLGQSYHFDDRGYMQTKWLYVSSNSAWYYLKSSGDMAKAEWIYDNGWYYLQADGVMCTGWLQLNEKWYYLNGSGLMQTGWVHTSTGWYYLKSSGDMAKAEWVYDNGWYYVDDEGRMCTGWLSHNNAWYYLSGSGLMQTGWIQTSTGWYYLSSNGSMLANTTTPDGWVVDANGKCIRSAGAWKRGANNQWYYEFQHGGYAANSWQSIDGVWYYFNQAGYAVTGWLKLHDTWYYFNDQCGMQTGWLKLNDKRYYLLTSGEMVVGTHTIDGSVYTFGADGALVTQAQPDNGAQPGGATNAPASGNDGHRTPSTGGNDASTPLTGASTDNTQDGSSATGSNRTAP